MHFKYFLLLIGFIAAFPAIVKASGIVVDNPMIYSMQIAVQEARGDNGDSSGLRGCKDMGTRIHPVIQCFGTKTVLIDGGYPAPARFRCLFEFRALDNGRAFELLREDCQSSPAY